jgi:hypothetical protein
MLGHCGSAVRLSSDAYRLSHDAPHPDSRDADNRSRRDMSVPFNARAVESAGQGLRQPSAAIAKPAGSSTQPRRTPMSFISGLLSHRSTVFFADCLITRSCAGKARQSAKNLQVAIDGGSKSS